MIFTILKTKARPITMKSYQCYVDVCIISYHITDIMYHIISLISLLYRSEVHCIFIIFKSSAMFFTKTC